MKRLACLLAVVLAFAVACGGSSGPHKPRASSATTSTTPTPTSTPSPTPTGPDGPAVVGWGVTGQLLGIVVSNPSAMQIVSAHVLITALDASQHPIFSTAGLPTSKCCTILGLPPGKRFGLFADLGPLASQVRGVQVRYLSSHFAAWEPKHAGTVSVRNAVFATEQDGNAEVIATLTAHGATGPYVVGQAFLTDPVGRLVGVISGRFYCFGDGVTRRLRMQFLHPVPAGTRVSAAVAYPVPPGQPTLVRDACTS